MTAAARTLFPREEQERDLTPQAVKALARQAIRRVIVPSRVTLGADVAITSVLLDGMCTVGTRGRRRYLEALRRFRSAGGRYCTWIDERGGLIPGHVRVVNANILRFLALTGEGTASPAAFVLREATDGGQVSGWAIVRSRPASISSWPVPGTGWVGQPG